MPALPILQRDLTPSYDEPAIRKHVEMLHHLAAGLNGKFVVSAFFANPNGEDRAGGVVNFIITDGSATGTPFQFTGSTLRLALANIGEVTAGIIRSPDSKMIINLTTGSLEWFD